MSFIGVFIIVFFFLVLVVGPLCAIEDRPGFLRPDRKPRQMIGSWFTR